MKGFFPVLGIALPAQSPWKIQVIGQGQPAMLTHPEESALSWGSSPLKELRIGKAVSGQGSGDHRSC